MVKGKTKSGIKYQINESVRDDARLLYMLVQLQRDERIRSIVSQRNRIAHGSSEDISQKEAEEILSQYRELEKNAHPLVGMKELSFSYLSVPFRY